MWDKTIWYENMNSRWPAYHFLMYMKSHKQYAGALVMLTIHRSFQRASFKAKCSHFLDVQDYDSSSAQETALS